MRGGGGGGSPAWQSPRQLDLVKSVGVSTDSKLYVNRRGLCVNEESLPVWAVCFAADGKRK